MLRHLTIEDEDQTPAGAVQSLWASVNQEVLEHATEVIRLRRLLEQAQAHERDARDRLAPLTAWLAKNLLAAAYGEDPSY